MEASRVAPRHLLARGAEIAKHGSGVLGATIVLVILFFTYAGVSSEALTSFGLTSLLNAGAALAIAAVGETIVVLVGGFDLSVGAVLSLVNVLVATQLRAGAWSGIAITALALVIGAAAGCTNGLLVSFFGISSIIATLATSFVFSGAALLLLPQPGGNVPTPFSLLFTGDIANDVPNALVVLLVVALVWFLIKGTRLGTAMYAIGSDGEASHASGINVRFSLFWLYALSGVFYGMAGVFLSALTASGDPNLGAPMTLSVFAAVVVGGTVLGGGKGGAIGSIIGAFVISLIANILFAVGISSFYTYIFTGLLLVIAVSLNSLRSGASSP
jgi:ribose transport system permease protein